MTDVDTAVDRIRATPAYRLLVIGYRCLPLRLLMWVVGVAVVALWSLKSPLVFIPFVIAIGTVFAGVIAVWAGLLTLRSRRLMPRSGTNRNAALMKMLWRDVIAPVRLGR